MKKIQLVLLALVLFSVGSIAQKGNNALGVGGELSIPMSYFGDDFKAGFGGYAKILHGIGTAGQLTLTGNVSIFKEREAWDHSSVVHMVPLMAGYRHNFTGLFVEPQFGYSIIGAKVWSEWGYENESSGMFVFGANVGYSFLSGLEISARYQNGGKHGTNFPLFGLRVGYNFALKGSKK